MKYLYLFLFIGLSSSAGAQARLTGRVVDAVTGRPVPYASLAVLNTRLGTTSNADGEFELPAPPLPARVLVADLGHVRDTVAVVIGQPLQIRLQPASVQLPEVAVGGNYLAELLVQAYRQLLRQQPQKTYGLAFYRQITRLDGAATEVLEMLWNTKTGNAGVEGTALAQGRYAAKKALLNFNNFSVYTKSAHLLAGPADSSTSTAVLGPNVARCYALKLLGVTRNGPQQLIEVGFASKPGATPRPSRGSLTIDEATHQVLRFRRETPATGMTSNNPFFKLKDPSEAVELKFRAVPGGAATLEYVQVSFQSVLGGLLKADVKIQVASFASFYDGQPTPTTFPYAPASARQSDLDAIKRKGYDAGFWQGNSVVKRTPLEEEVIKSFEQKGAFGTLVPH